MARPRSNAAPAQPPETSAKIVATEAAEIPAWLRPIVEQTVERILRERAPADEFIDLQELVRRLKTSERTVRGQVRRRQIPCIKVPGGRRVQFYWPAVLNALQRFETGGHGQ